MSGNRRERGHKHNPRERNHATVQMEQRRGVRGACGGYLHHLNVSLLLQSVKLLLLLSATFVCLLRFAGPFQDKVPSVCPLNHNRSLDLLRIGRRWLGFLLLLPSPRLLPLPNTPSSPSRRKRDSAGPTTSASACFWFRFPFLAFWCGHIKGL